MDIEIPIGTKLSINGVPCEVTESRKCSNCEVHKQTFNRYRDKERWQCGTRHHGNLSDFACTKESRSDGKNIIFKSIS